MPGNFKIVKTTAADCRLHFKTAVKHAWLTHYHFPWRQVIIKIQWLSASMCNENEGRFGMSHVKTPGPSCKGQLHHNIKGNWSLCTHLSPFYGGYLCISHCTYYRCHIIDLGAVKGLLPITEFLTVCWWQLYRAGLGWGTMSFFIRKKSTNLFNLPYACNY